MTSRSSLQTHVMAKRPNGTSFRALRSSFDLPEVLLGKDYADNRELIELGDYFANKDVLGKYRGKKVKV